MLASTPASKLKNYKVVKTALQIRISNCVLTLDNFIFLL